MFDEVKQNENNDIDKIVINLFRYYKIPMMISNRMYLDQILKDMVDEEKYNEQQEWNRTKGAF